MSKDSIRMSQVIGVFGPGAMLDLPDRSVVVGGLEKWDMHARGSFQVIEEPRLQRLLKQWLSHPDDPRLAADCVPELRTPPVDPDNPRTPHAAINAPIFPEWFVCNALAGDPPGQRRLVRFDDLDPPLRQEYRTEDGKKCCVSPIRFVCGCTKGHLQDIEWRRILHAQGETCREQMWLKESGTSADPRDMSIVCDCGRSLTLAQLFQPGRLGPCRGERPWIGDRDPVPCDAPKGLTLLTRSATNTYFPEIATIISLPRAEDELSRRVEQHWSELQKAASVAEIASARKFNPAIAASLEGFPDEAVFARVQELAKRVEGGEAADPHLAEFDLLASGRALIGDNSPAALLHAETLARPTWDPDDSPELAGVGSLVAVHRLREVSCLYGFTRFEPAMLANDDLEDIGLAVEGAPLGKDPTWLPAIEKFGEGIFLTFAPEKLAAWLATQGLRDRAAVLERGVATWERLRRARRLIADRRTLGERVRPEYVMAHSLAHALMIEVAIDCGYPSSALAERIYVPRLQPGEAACAGLLLYTATAGTQGTLGGLVEVTRRFPRVLHSALERLRLCSGDPICADHDPGTGDEDRALHGAACHGCLLVAETSCEARNLFLDRALLVETMAGAGAGFFF